MTSFNIDSFLSGHAFAFVMVFARVGCAMMLMPGIGEAYVPSRSRLMLALTISALLLEPLLPRLPPIPDNIGDLALTLGYEIIIGLFFGTFLRLLMTTLEATGMVIGLQSGLSNATVINPALSSQSPLPSAFLSVVAITMVFVTGLDHMLFRGIVELYDVFPPRGAWLPGDMAETIIEITNKSFVMGIELAMPFFVVGLLLYIAVGVLQKLTPSVQLFMVLMPVQIWGGLTLLSLTTAAIITLWLQYVDTTLSSFLGH
jgi:flagellar biosynthetic protein FliR